MRRNKMMDSKNKAFYIAWIMAAIIDAWLIGTVLLHNIAALPNTVNLTTQVSK